ncbi:MAG: diacylglycerol/lipid kinase family protein [Solirubrobacteraceae bacterium]
MTARHESRSLALIVNPRAGGGIPRRRLPEVQSLLRTLGAEHRVALTDDLDHARELARDATAAGEAAVAFGGDGLIGAIADELRHADGVLGILPGGRGNDFARSLGIPLDLGAACGVLATGAVGRLDLGLIGERAFVGIASCGFDSVANRIANETMVIRGRLVYAYAALRALAHWRPVQFTVTIDGGPERSFSGYTVVVANSRCYGGGMMIAPGASVHDGMLDVVIVHHMSRLRFLRLLPMVFSGAHIRLEAVSMQRGAAVRVSASRPFTVYADGDPIAELPATITTLPAAVRAILPATDRSVAAAALGPATG